MTTTFYVPPDAVRGNMIVLPEDESRHVARSLRKETGDEILVVDGEGRRYRVRIDQIGKRQVTGTILQVEEQVGEPPFQLTVGLALLKNRNRFETFVEKAAELGVHTIQPLHTARTEKEGLRLKRARRILIAAMKQSGRSRLPQIHAPRSVAQIDPSTYDLAFLCHEQEHGCSLMQALRAGPDATNVLMLVGPEGGFSDEEVEDLTVRGARSVHLGPRRLRAETAALVASSALMLEREQ